MILSTRVLIVPCRHSDSSSFNFCQHKLDYHGGEHQHVQDENDHHWDEEQDEAGILRPIDEASLVSHTRVEMRAGIYIIM